MGTKSHNRMVSIRHERGPSLTAAGADKTVCVFVCLCDVQNTSVAESSDPRCLRSWQGQVLFFIDVFKGSILDEATRPQKAPEEKDLLPLGWQIYISPPDHCKANKQAPTSRLNNDLFLDTIMSTESCSLTSLQHYLNVWLANKSRKS